MRVEFSNLGVVVMGLVVSLWLWGSRSRPRRHPPANNIIPLRPRRRAGA